MLFKHNNTVAWPEKGLPDPARKNCSVSASCCHYRSIGSQDVDVSAIRITVRPSCQPQMPLLGGMGLIEKRMRVVDSALHLHGCFMVGNKGETRATMEETLRFAVVTNPDTAQFFPLIPYPATEAFAWARENGNLATTDYARWLTAEGQHQCVLNLPGLSAEELVSFCDHARKRYYLRPRYLLHKLAQCLRSPAERQRTLKSFRQFRSIACMWVTVLTQH